MTKLTFAAFLLALILSAGLLFNIQPMVGKMLLPLVGGTPAVWNVAMAFFQLSLLLGYLVAHFLSKTPARIHGVIYLALLASAWVFLPIALPHGWQPDTSGQIPFQVLGVLFVSVAAPFVALSLSAPTLQRLFSHTAHHSAADPYFLYAASNFGSFAGLLIYPLLLEPNWDVHQQTVFWQMAYGLLLAIVALCLMLPHKGVATVAQTAPAPSKPSRDERLRWIGLAFIPSSLTLGVTTHISTDITPTPMLWVVTLGLYLLTFVIAFAKSGEMLRELNLRYYHILGCLALALYTIRVDAHFLTMSLVLLAFFVVALACHTQLARSRPASSKLTEYYFWLSVGGALVGSFNAFLAPVLFPDYFEYPLVLLMGLLAYVPLSATQAGPSKARNLTMLALILLVCFLLLWRDEIYKHSVILAPSLIALIVTTTLLMLRRQKMVFALALTSVFLGGILSVYLQSPLFRDRSFFGVLRVDDLDQAPEPFTLRQLAHGTTQHGAQIVRPNILSQPTTYYSVFSPIGTVMRVLQPVDVALIGLGAGSLNCYARAEDKYTYIEIDPLVVHAAQKYFTFLSDCSPPRLIVGDGRIELAKLSESFDLIVIDAFSSDAIPVHLLTREAFAMYLSKLREGGIIMVHISNRYFNLARMLSALAADMGLQAFQALNAGRLVNEHIVHFPSEWVALTRDQAWLERLKADSPPLGGLGLDKIMQTAAGLSLKAEWQPMTDRSARIWTDSYSNLLAVMK